MLSSTLNDEQTVNSVTDKTKNSDNTLSPNTQELEFIIKHRQKIWLKNPTMLHTFAATPKNNFYVLAQFISLMVGISLFMLINVGVLFLESSKKITGLGMVSEQTWLPWFSTFFMLVIINKAYQQLKKNMQSKNIKGYKLAMMSNSFLRLAFNQIKLILVFFIFSAFYGINEYKETAMIFSEMMDGSFSQYLDIFFNLMSLIFTYRAFRFCNKDIC